jgi:hypothetical protein
VLYGYGYRCAVLYNTVHMWTPMQPCAEGAAKQLRICNCFENLRMAGCLLLLACFT